jgi:hypothetical protein
MPSLNQILPFRLRPFVLVAQPPFLKQPIEHSTMSDVNILLRFSDFVSAMYLGEKAAPPCDEKRVQTVEIARFKLLMRRQEWK